MASYRSIQVACEAVLDVLRDNVPDELSEQELEFEVYTSRSFNHQPMTAGVSLMLYRIYPNTVVRTPGGRFSAEGRRKRSRLPVDLHFILTVWAQSASLQHTLAGWMMREFESHSVLPSALLNRRETAFRSDEALEIVLGDLDTENLFRLWETVAQNAYNLSVPYVIRTLMIESDEWVDDAKPAQTREFEVIRPSSHGEDIRNSL